LNHSFAAVRAQLEASEKKVDTLTDLVRAQGLMLKQLLEHGGVGVGVHATQHVESNPQLPASATDTDGPSHPHPNVPARSPSGEATLKRLRVANDNEKVGYDLSDKKSSDFYIDCMTLHQGELPAHFGGTHDSEKAYRQKAKTCLSFYKAMQPDEVCCFHWKRRTTLHLHCIISCLSWESL